MLGSDEMLLNTYLGAGTNFLALENSYSSRSRPLLIRLMNAHDDNWFINSAIPNGPKSWDAAIVHALHAAIEELRDYLFHIHLKDVLHVGEPHETCLYGQGIVPIEECVWTLQRVGYAGAITVEHEPEDHDPTEEIKQAFDMLRAWLKE